LAGGGARIRLIGGLGIQADLSYLYRSQQDRDILLIPTLIYEFRRQIRFVPYVVGGGGLEIHRGTWGSQNFSSKLPIYEFGFVAKVFLTKKTFVSAEIRSGHEPHARIAGSFGYVLKK
jgi:hypothetical protein